MASSGGPRAVVLAGIAAVVVVLAACSDETDDASTAMACTPGASVACTGAGGCAGGQVCKADGSGFDTCVCGAGADGGSSGSSGSSGSGPTDSGSAPKYAEVRVTFTLESSGSGTTTCAANPSIVQVSATLTPAGGTGITKTNSFPCAEATGKVSGIDFGAYKLVVDALNSEALSLGSSAPQDLKLEASPCDAIDGNQCVKNVNVVIKLD